MVAICFIVGEVRSIGRKSPTFDQNRPFLSLKIEVESNSAFSVVGFKRGYTLDELLKLLRHRKPREMLFLKTKNRFPKLCKPPKKSFR